MSENSSHLRFISVSPANWDAGQILFSFSGRISRLTYWLGMLGVFASTFVISELTTSFMPRQPGSAIGTFAITLNIAVFTIYTWIILALLTKRWHDLGKSGNWTLIGLIPFIGPIWVFIECGWVRGTLGRNKYGRDPS
ncbi:DUF805 domain-containing protein [Luteolibacter yonseiensis]|uniref:DUF805 domain-containing protein n=1 Tax=Luteolibacter yonseiensis TaxID=1144680 RepID=A0A934R562_9BACT|nr:DUF805 domain-containing protein [Luteolibacter yonseiensis]MBK1817167.1 DUF805 domain-containing protein [Luteolibacter yonseiensis]